MLESTDLHWLAGLLEGEGCFYIRKRGEARHPNPTIAIQLSSTDQDVVTKAANIMKGNVRGPYDRGPKRKLVYTLAVNGGKAAGWMMTLYTLMCRRRQGKIRECLAVWRTT